MCLLLTHIPLLVSSRDSQVEKLYLTQLFSLSGLFRHHEALIPPGGGEGLLWDPHSSKRF